jgi:hypothetical protein
MSLTPTKNKNTSKKAIWAANQWAKDEQPSSTSSWRRDDQNLHKSTFGRLGLVGSSNIRSQTKQSQSNQLEPPRENKSKLQSPVPPRYYSCSRQIDNRWEGGAESRCRSTTTPNTFPCFSSRLLHKFKPSNHSKYDGKREPRADIKTSKLLGPSRRYNWLLPNTSIGHSIQYNFQEKISGQASAMLDYIHSY